MATIVVIDVLLVVYSVGIARRVRERRRLPSYGHHLAFLFGLAAIGVALVGPLDAHAHRSVAAHMAQHLLLTAVAPPRLVLARPLPVLLAALPDRARIRATKAAAAALPDTRGARWLWWAAVAAIAQVTTIALWHLPALYDAATRHDLVHLVEHATMLASSVLLWFVLVGAPGRRHLGEAALVLFVTSLPMIVLGAAMTLARQPWYQLGTGTFADRLADQQLAGAFLWSIGGSLTALGGIGAFASWLASADRHAAFPPRSVAPH
jgi:putative membrane protein